MQTSLDVALARISYSDELLCDLDLTIVRAGKPHDANTLDLLRTVPGIGTMLRLVVLDELPDIERFPRVQEFASYGRLVTWAKASAGKRSGTAGPNIGHAHLQGACSEAAVLCLRDHPAGQHISSQMWRKHIVREKP